MTLPVELETSVTQLRAKHTALMDAVDAYRSGTIDASKQDLLDLANDIDKQLTVEEHTLLGQVARKGRMPSLLLDFANDKYAVGDRRLERFTSLGALLTFTRSTGGGRFNAQGQYEWVGPDVPRIDYDPVTGECRGLLIEEQRTNLATGPYSGFHTGNGSGVTFEPVPPFLSDPGVTPDAVRVSTTGETAATRFQYSAESQAVGELFTMSWYERYVDYTPGVGTSALSLSSLVGLEIQTPLTLQEVKPGIFRATVTLVTTLVGTVIFRAYFTKFTNVLNAVEFWAFQIERGPFPTSYIPTEGSAVTRAADIADVGVEGWFNPREGAVVTAYDFIDGSVEDTGRTYPGSLRQPSRLITLGCYHYGRIITQRPHTQVGGFVGFTDESSKIGYTYDRSGRISLANQEGTLRAGSMELVMETTSVLNIATNAAYTRTHSGHVRSIEYYPRALSDTELQELTKP